MLSIIRRRVTYANVAMTLTLVFAMSGGAYAAGKFLITSTKQIKPSVLSSLKGKAGPAGPTGLAGAAGPAGGTGPQGPAGPSGAAGAKGETGVAGVAGTAGKEGKAGKEGSPWTAGGTLPVGATETGTFTSPNFAGESIPGGALALPISFPIRLASELAAGKVEVVKKGATGTSCTGSPANPTAPSGFLCVYVEEEQPPTKLEYFVRQSGTKEGFGASTTGAIVEIVYPKSEEHEVYGTWAVTG